jgi:hypothetical protein
MISRERLNNSNKEVLRLRPPRISLKVTWTEPGSPRREAKPTSFMFLERSRLTVTCTCNFHYFSNENYLFSFRKFTVINRLINNPNWLRNSLELNFQNKRSSLYHVLRCFSYVYIFTIYLYKTSLYIICHQYLGLSIDLFFVTFLSQNIANK